VNEHRTLRDATRFRRALVATLLAIVGMATLLPGTSFADNTLVSSDPADGSTLEQSPETISFSFTEPLGEVNTITLTCDDLYTVGEVAEMFQEVVSYHIDPEKCQACMICGRHCPVDGIAGGKHQIHVIDQDECIHCGSCYAACPGKFDAIQKIVGAPIPPPIPEDQRTVVRKKK
jgi:NAD-dependent dihydropyrimidine dehydrogenase PreA subunit